MKSKLFLKLYSIITILVIIVLISINYSIDIFGLFLNRNKVTVHTNERISKFLLTKKYIPNNFEAVILGPSLSNNLDPTIIKEYNIYNLSVMGANMHEMEILFKSAIESNSKFKFAIVCLDPYVIRKDVINEVFFDDKQQRAALGSCMLFKTYSISILRSLNILKSKAAKDVFNYKGQHDFNKEMHRYNPVPYINKELNRTNEQKHICVNPMAIGRLASIIQLCKDNNIELVMYHSPIPKEIYIDNYDNYADFEDIIQFVADDNEVLNFNTRDFDYITTDYTNYIDHGHLSTQGHHKVLKCLVNYINQECID